MRTLDMHKLSLTAAAVLLTSAGAEAADGPIFRHSADFFKFDGTEFVTGLTPNPTTGAGGALFFSKSVTLPTAPSPVSNVLYVSFFATGDAFSGAAEWFNCRVMFSGFRLQNCRPSIPSDNGAPNGWVSLLRLPNTGVDVNCFGDGDCLDNAIAYQWCVPIPPGAPTAAVALRMATSISGSLVFLEQGHVYIDSSHIDQPDKCVKSPFGSSLGPKLEPSDVLADSVTKHPRGKK